MKQPPDRKASATLGAEERARALEAERRARLAVLEQRHTALSDEEYNDLVDVFPVIFDDHCELIWKALHKRGAPDDAMDDLIQDCVESFLIFARESGLPVSLPAKLQSIAGGLVWNHLRGKKRDVVTLGAPPSSQTMPQSWQELESVLGGREVARRLFNLLSPEHRAVVDAVILRELSYEAAALELELAPSTVRDRLKAAQKRLVELAQIIPVSERRPR